MNISFLLSHNFYDLRRSRTYILPCRRFLDIPAEAIYVILDSGTGFVLVIISPDPTLSEDVMARCKKLSPTKLPHFYSTFSDIKGHGKKIHLY